MTNIQFLVEQRGLQVVLCDVYAEALPEAGSIKHVYCDNGKSARLCHKYYADIYDVQ